MLHKPAFASPFASLSPRALYRLMTWFSPAFPVGAYSYSSGIEWAVEAGDVVDAESLRRWIRVLLVASNGYCDAVLAVHAHRAVLCEDEALLAEIAGLATAFAPSKERFAESTQQGRAFFAAMRESWPCAALDRLPKIWEGPLALPVAVAVALAGYDIPVEPGVHAYLQAITANLVSAGVRLIPLGQTDGQRVLAAIEADIAGVVERALVSDLDDLGTFAFRADLATMHHETQYTRLYRS